MSPPTLEVMKLTACQRLLLDAALQPRDRAIDAFHRWQGEYDIETLDTGSFFLLPAAYLNVREALGDHDRTLPRLKGIHRYAWCMNQTASRSMLEVQRLFDDAGVDVMVLKGLPLVLHHYGELGARLMYDIDLLIRPEQIDAAASALSRGGWTARQNLPSTFLAPFLHAESYKHPRLIEIDLHWHPFLIDCPRDVEDGLWQRAVRRPILGTPVLMPEPTDFLLLICLGNFKADEQSIGRGLVDAVRLIASADPPIDWAALLDRARATRLVQPVRQTLAYLRDELGMTQADAFFELADDADADPSPDIRLISGSWVTGVGTRDLFANHWQRYRNVRRAMRRSAGPADFARYLLAYYRWKWQMDSPWRVPLRGARKFLRHVGRSREIG